MSVLTIGETMALVRAAEIGPIEHVSGLRLGIGGAESNVAVGLRRLGRTVTWLGRVGDDGLGRRVARELRAEGIDVRAIVDPDAPTGLMLKEARTGTATRVTYYRAHSAGSRLRPEDLAEVDLGGIELVHLTGITPALGPSARAACEWLLDRAGERGIPVSFDVNHRTALWREDPGPLYRSLAARASVVFAGEDEARLLVPGADGPRALAEGIAALGAAEVVIKLGAEGALALIDGRATTCAAVPITPLDTVGAGDAFVAGYLAERLAGAGVAERLLTAVRTGAFACLHPGDWEGFARREELGLLESAEPVVR